MPIRLQSGATGEILAAFFAALALRAFSFALLRGLESAQVLGVDSAYYHARATALVEGTAPTAGVQFLGPLFPHWLAGLYRVAGTQPDVARGGQILLSAATVALIFAVVREFLDRRHACVAALLFALYGYGSFLDTQIVMAPLLTCLLVAAGAALMRAVRLDSWKWAVAAGLPLGLAAQGRGTFAALALGAALCLWAISTRPRSRRAGVGVAALLFGAALGLAPSALHDLRASSGRTLLPVNGGVNLYIGLHEAATGRYVDLDGVRFFEEGASEDGGSIAEASRRAGRPLDAVEANRWWIREALRFARENPGAALALTARKLRFALGDAEIAQIENFEWARSESALLRGNPIRFGSIGALGIVGSVLLWRRRPESRVWIALGIGHLLLLLPFFLTARYRYPLAAILVPGAAYTLLLIFDALRAKQWRQGLLPAAATFALAAALWSPANPNTRSDALAHADYTRGVLAMQEGELEEAIEAYQSSFEHDPAHVPTAANLAWCLLRSGRAEESLRWFETVRRLEPSNRVIAGFEGEALLRVGRVDEAEQLLREHLALAPQDLPAQLSYGDVAHAQGRIEVARRHWEYVAREGHPEPLRTQAQQRLEGLDGRSP